MTALCVVAGSCGGTTAERPDIARTRPDGATLACPRPFEPMPANACLAVPERFDDPRRLIVFFPGMRLPLTTGSADDLREMAAGATARGYAVLAVFGEPGLCDWSADVQRFLCFPAGDRHLARVGGFLQRLGELLPAVSRRVRSPLGPPLLAGFSNGGFFVALLAAKTQLAAAGYAIVHGGVPDGPIAFPRSRARPTILLAAHDDTFQLAKMQQLSERLNRRLGP